MPPSSGVGFELYIYIYYIYMYIYYIYIYMYVCIYIIYILNIYIYIIYIYVCVYIYMSNPGYATASHFSLKWPCSSNDGANSSSSGIAYGWKHTSRALMLLSFYDSITYQQN